MVCRNIHCFEERMNGKRRTGAEHSCPVPLTLAVLLLFPPRIVFSNYFLLKTYFADTVIVIICDVNIPLFIGCQTYWSVKSCRSRVTILVARGASRERGDQALRCYFSNAIFV